MAAYTPPVEQATTGTSGPPGDGESTDTAVPGRGPRQWARVVARRVCGALSTTGTRWRPVAPGSGLPRSGAAPSGLPRLGRSRRLDREAFLADATGILDTSLDPRHVAEMTASLTVPTFADSALVFLPPDLAGSVTPRPEPNSALDPDALPLAAIVDRDPGATAVLRTLSGMRPASVHDEFGPGLVLRTGQTWYVPYMPSELEAVIFPPEFASSRYRAGRRGPTLAVPLSGRGRVVGVLLLSRHRSRFREDEIGLLEEFGRRAGVAMDNAVLYSAEQESALTLQRSLLPHYPPALMGAQVAMDYRPGTAGTQVGGDLYDVITLGEAKVGLAIGDVMGRGLGAAAQMGQLRAALRALALSGYGPSSLLTGLARTASSLDVSFATCLYAEYDPNTGRLLLASAGHLPPLLLIPDEPVAYADLRPGLCFGIEDGVPYEETAIDLPPGSAVVFFTDGLVESRRQSVDEGMERLRAVLAGEGTAIAVPDDGLGGVLSGEPPTHQVATVDTRAGSDTRARGEHAARAGPWDPRRPPADLVQRALEAMGSNPSSTDDDVAVLVLTTRARPVKLLDIHLDAGPRAAGVARDALGDALRGHGLDELIDDARLLVSELVANGVRFARSDLRVRAGVDGDRLRVGVEDREASAWPRRIRPRSDDEFGRGLVIVDALAHSWGMETTSSGKRVWFDLVGNPEPAGHAH